MCCSCTLWVTCPLTIVMGLNPCTIIVIACRVWVSPWPCLDSSLGFSSRRFSKYFCVLIGHPSGQDGRDWPLSVILRKKKHCVERTLSMMESHKAAEDNQNKGKHKRLSWVTPNKLWKGLPPFSSGTYTELNLHTFSGWNRRCKAEEKNRIYTKGQ